MWLKVRGGRERESEEGICVFVRVDESEREREIR